MASTLEDVRKITARPDVRRGTVTAAALVALVGLLVSSGLVDGGPLESRPSLLTPAARASGIWWVIHVLLLSYAVWQWLPIARDEPRTVASAYPAAGALALSGLWVLVAQADRPVVPVAVLIALLICLGLTLRRVSRHRSGRVVRQLTQLPFALPMGWATIAMGGAVAGMLAEWGVPALWVAAPVWGVLGTTALLGLGMALVRYFDGRLFIGLGAAWGFVWVAYERLLGTPRSYAVGLVAGIAAMLIVVAAIAVFLWARARARH